MAYYVNLSGYSRLQLTHHYGGTFQPFKGKHQRIISKFIVWLQSFFSIQIYRVARYYLSSAIQGEKKVVTSE